jgi:uncharacterized repeat protein (TIGR03837 family)
MIVPRRPRPFAASIIGRMRWTVFCRVVDNFGDIGFAWRLAADLGSRGEDVRLAVDDRSALAWMAPHGAPNVEVLTWTEAACTTVDVWVETFGCGLPDASPAEAATRRIDINVEHLSAERYVERSHGRPSPRFDAAGRSPPLFFFYPGFSERTGGLIREPGLLERRTCFDASDWLRGQGIERREGERCVSLFCYANAPLAEWLGALAAAPTLLLLTPGPAAAQARALLGPDLQCGQLRAHCVAALSQNEFDRLLWSCDLNFVRGEDSLARAIWAGAPFVWQLYPQDDGAHAAKLEAFLALLLDDAPPALARLGSLFASWNGLGMAPELHSTLLSLDIGAWATQCRRLRERCAGHADLSSALRDFVALKG